MVGREIAVLEEKEAVQESFAFLDRLMGLAAEEQEGVQEVFPRRGGREGVSSWTWRKPVCSLTYGEISLNALSRYFRTGLSRLALECLDGGSKGIDELFFSWRSDH